jgi:hypothetical protein
MEKADELLRGAIDMHAHGYPQFTLNMPPRVNDLEWAQAALEAGMAGFVIKSHMWPTTTSAYLLNQIVEGIKVFGSITLNYVVGGLSPLAVQIAAESGAKVVFMPTWSAKNDMDKGKHYFTRMRPYVTTIDSATENLPGLKLTGADGALIPDVVEIIGLCKKYDMVLASGHISIEESLALCKEATKAGVKFVLTHPLNSPLVGATLDQQKEVARMGGYVEHVFIGCMPMHQRMHPKTIAEAIEYVGYKHCIMSSDCIEAWNPKPPEVLRMFIASMMTLGIPEDAIYHMTHTNPGRLMNLDV